MDARAARALTRSQNKEYRRYCLSKSIERGDHRFAQHLIRTVDVRATYAGTTFLTLAARFGRVDMVRLLLPRSYPNFQCRCGCAYTALMEASETPETIESRAVVELLLPHSDTRLVNGGGLTPLHLAVVMGNAAIVQLLLPFSDVNVRCGAGMAPIDLAASGGFDNIVSILAAAASIDEALLTNALAWATHCKRTSTALLLFDLIERVASPLVSTSTTPA